MLKKRMDNYANKSRKRWVHQNYQALLAEDKKLQQQQQGR